MRRFVPALAVLAALSFSAVARAEDRCETADRLEREARSLFEQGRRADGARLMSKAWRLRAEAWGAEMRPEAGVPAAPGVPTTPGVPASPGAPDPMATTVTDARVKEALAKLETAVERLKAESTELEQQGKAAQAAGNEALASEKMEASARVWRKAEEMEKALRTEREFAKQRKVLEAEAPRPERAAEEKAHLAKVQEKLARLKAEADEWAAKAKELDAKGYETGAAEARAKAAEASARARHLRDLEESLAAARPIRPGKAWPGTEERAELGGLAMGREKLARLKGAAEEWAAKATALEANGHEKEAAEAKAKAMEASEQARHLETRLAAAEEDLRAHPWKLLQGGDKPAPPPGIEAEMRRLRAEVEELRKQIDALRAGR